MRTRHEFFEDFEIGQSGVTRMRTVGEPDIVAFACITCDYSYVHLAHHPNVDGPYGGRIAHGLLGSSLAAGLLSLDAPHLVGRGVPGSYFSGFDANYRDAIRLGDTVRIAWKVGGKRDDPEDAAFGVVRTDFQLLTQLDRAVYDGSFELRVRKSSGGQGGPILPRFRSPAPWKVRDFAFHPEKVYDLEDFPVGEGAVTLGRTVTETDIVNFAGLTGDYNPCYVDASVADKGPLGARIVPGLLVFTMAFGLWTRDGEVMRAKSSDPSKDAGHLNDSSVFHQPVRIGDSIRCQYKIADTRASKSKPDRGIVTYGFQILNQRDEVVQEGKTLMLKATRRTG
jgi:acyl dehydratase